MKEQNISFSLFNLPFIKLLVLVDSSQFIPSPLFHPDAANNHSTGIDPGPRCVTCQYLYTWNERNNGPVTGLYVCITSKYTLSKIGEKGDWEGDTRPPI